LFIRDGLRPSRRLPLIVHFHGAPWLIEHHIAKLKQGAVLVTFQLGDGSGIYARPFADPAQFASLLKDTSAGVEKVLGRKVTLDPVVLSSWSAGYGAIRAILRQPESYARVSSVLLSDSMHADYNTIDADTDVFQRLAADAAAGRKRFVLLHSEVFPGTYASTTETADAVLKSLNLKRKPVLRQGPLGMQQLSETKRRNLAVIGYAGNSAPDHTDHLYALGDQLTRWKVVKD
jgi:hypothetical protein